MAEAVPWILLIRHIPMDLGWYCCNILVVGCEVSRGKEGVREGWQNKRHCTTSCSTWRPHNGANVQLLHNSIFAFSIPIQKAIILLGVILTQPDAICMRRANANYSFCSSILVLQQLHYIFTLLLSDCGFLVYYCVRHKYSLSLSLIYSTDGEWDKERTNQDVYWIYYFKLFRVRLGRWWWWWVTWDYRDYTVSIWCIAIGIIR